MKRVFTLVLAVLLVLALFAGCKSGGDDKTTDQPTNTATNPPDGTKTDTPKTDTPVDPDPDSPYNYAVGKYEKNDKGYPTAAYDYELPLTTTDEELTYWTVVWTPQVIDPDVGYGGMDFAKGLQELTGVNIAYEIVDPAARAEQYSILLAADELRDMMCGGSAFHTGTPEEALEDGYWVNIYDYMDYCPNYIYEATKDPAEDTLYNAVFYKPGKIIAFQSMMKQAFVGSNYMARGDWLRDLGMKNDDIVTYDDVKNMLTAFKTGVDTCEFPLPLFSSIDMAGNAVFVAYDTIPYISPYSAIGTQFVIDGEVILPHVRQQDKEFVTMLNDWYAAGLIDPNWTAYPNNTAFTDKTTTSQVGYVYMSPGEVSGYEAGTEDPDCEWVPIHRPLRTAGQTVHVGGSISRSFYGSAIISATCENIPLAVTWLDFRYSPKGSEYVSWGPEGHMWNWDSNGNRMATEWALTDAGGVSYAWACMVYQINTLAEPGLEDGMRKYAYEGGDRIFAIHDYWADWNYDNAWRWPAAIKLTKEQTDEVNVYSADVLTYLGENYATFVDGSNPMSNWDTYVTGLEAIGYTQIRAVLQQAYDDYMATQG